MINNYIYRIHHKLDKSKLKLLVLILLISPLSLITLCDNRTSLSVCVILLLFVTLPITLYRIAYINGSLKFNKNLYGSLPQAGDVYVVIKTITNNDNGFAWQVESGNEIKVTSIPTENKQYPISYFFFCDINGTIRVIDFIKFHRNLTPKSEFRNKKLHKILGRKFGF